MRRTQQRYSRPNRPTARCSLSRRYSNDAYLNAAIGLFGNADNFWRGHRSAHYPLVAGVFRREPNESPEAQLILRFSGRAGARRNRLPRRDERIDWLLLAQHYGLPTRLLDWSLSALVALFFAVEAAEADDRNDACLYALNASGLNQAMGRRRALVHLDDPIVSGMAEQAFGASTSRHLPDAIALDLFESDKRMMLQRAGFTLHSSRRDLSGPGSEKYLVKFLIPRRAKPKLRWLLQLAGISRSSLFPDLPTLAEEIRRG